MPAPTAYVHNYAGNGATSTVFRATPPATSQSYPSPAPTAQSYYNYPAQNWQHWQPATYPFTNSQAYYQSAGYTTAAAALAKGDGKQHAVPVPPRRPPTPPPPDPVLPKHWDEVLMDFFKTIGFTQTRKGFEMDVLVMNPDWEKKKVSAAIQRLVQGLSVAHDPNAEPIEERKLAYTHAPNLQPTSSINKSISQFLAENRRRNDASNRAEFVDNLKRKRQRMSDGEAPPQPDTQVAESADTDAGGSCARTDARQVDRDRQMKYDIAKNEDGPLRRTVKKDEEPAKPPAENSRTADMDERVGAVEQHLALQYVPTQPSSVAYRLKLIEDHISHLERDYPPWAALHFNQPNRGWPPPPRTTPVIVPVQMRSAAPPPPPPTAAEASASASQPTSSRTRTKSSSLHRAVLERLEVQQARRDLAGAGEG